MPYLLMDGPFMCCYSDILFTPDIVGRMAAASDDLVLGVDTHFDFHVAVALDELGGRLGDLTVPTTAKRATTPSFHGPKDSAL